jgi:hypothetical protein
LAYKFSTQKTHFFRICNLKGKNLNRNTIKGVGVCLLLLSTKL